MAPSTAATLTLGNGRVTGYGYEPDGALDTLRHAGLVGGVDAVWSFDYNLANQVTGRSVSHAQFLWRPGAAGAETYAVNGLNQYTQVSPGGGRRPARHRLRP